MEISKGLQLEIQSVQSKLKNAIRDHQISVEKLKDDPSNPDILDRIQEIQIHIVSLGRCQKQVVERLRKEVDEYKAVNANEAKVSVASLLGLNNNNHITANNELATDEISEVRLVANGLDNDRLADNPKEDYEDIVRNGDVASPQEAAHKKARSSSVETLSVDDEEVIEVSLDEDMNKCQISEESRSEMKIKCNEQQNFLEILGLITTLRSTDLQNRRAERKRRSTANPQFVYSNWEMPTKRKRHSYLQSAGANVPQTRQTTARLNGPSPPPICNKLANSIVPPKSTSPPDRTSKCLIPVQKATTRPNILRNMSESRVFPSKVPIKIENENGHSQAPCNSINSGQSSNSKTVHIPGLPSSLTIERIESDSAVCINCRNPGTLMNCDNCDANYHVSCHSISPPPPRLCPKCAVKMTEAPGTIKKNDEIAAASYAPGVAGKAGEDPEVDKASSGLYSIGAGSERIAGVNKLPGSTMLIPIRSSGIAVKSEGKIAVERGIVQSTDGKPITGKQSESYSTSIILNNHFSRSTVTYVPQPERKQQQLASAYKLPIIEYWPKNGSEVVVADEKATKQGSSTTSVGASERGKNTFSGAGEEKTSGSESGGKPGKLTGSVPRLWKKSTNRAVPGLTRIVPIVERSRSRSSSGSPEHGNNDDLDKLQSVPRHNGKTYERPSGNRSTELLAHENEGSESGRRQLVPGERKIKNEGLFPRSGEPTSGPFHPLFAGYNESHILANGHGESSRREIPGNHPPQIFQPTDEHVKLEEAHLSAPLGTKLIDYLPRSADRFLSINADLQIRPVLERRRRTTEDREHRQLPRILMRQCRRSSESREPDFRQNQTCPIPDRLPVTKDEKSDTSDTSATDDASSPPSYHRFHENIRDPPVALDIDDEETDDNEEDIDCPIVDENIGPNEELRISAVSPESMRVLEQFETAMMRDENGHKTANT